MKLSSILSLAAAIGTTTFTSAQHHNLPPTDTSKFNGINSPTNSIVPNDVDVVAVDAVAVDEADNVSRKLHDDNKHDMFAMIEAVIGGVISREPRDCYIRNKKILLAAAFSRHYLQLLSNMLHGYL